MHQTRSVIMMKSDFIEKKEGAPVSSYFGRPSRDGLFAGSSNNRIIGAIQRLFNIRPDKSESECSRLLKIAQAEAKTVFDGLRNMTEPKAKIVVDGLLKTFAPTTIIVILDNPTLRDMFLNYHSEHFKIPRQGVASQRLKDMALSNPELAIFILSSTQMISLLLVAGEDSPEEKIRIISERYKDNQ